MREIPINNRTVFVLESKNGALDSIVEHLNELELTVERFHDANELLAKAERVPPTAVVVDLLYSLSDPLSAVQKLAEAPLDKRPRLVAISDKPYEFDRNRAINLGVDAYFIQPVKREEFLHQLESLLHDFVRIQFWGVRGTLPVPGETSIRYGGNTSCVTMEFARGQHFVFDAGSGIRLLSDHLMKTPRRLQTKIFISHPHWDHINALPFFTPLYVQGNDIEILGASHADISMRELMSAQMDGVYFPVNFTEFAARVYFRNLTEETIDVHGIKVSTMLLSHPGNCLGYRVEYSGRVLCYVTDNELYPDYTPHYNERYRERLAKFIEGADVLITDTTYTDEEYRSRVSWGHSSVEEVVEIAAQANVKTLYLFHHDPAQSDKDIEKKHALSLAMVEELGSPMRVVAPAEGDTFVI